MRSMSTRKIRANSAIISRTRCQANDERQRLGAAGAAERYHGLGMSKAFTKDDGEGEPPLVTSRRAPLPDGAPNYVTARGLAQLRTELDQQSTLEAYVVGSDAERARAQALRAARIAEIEARLASAVLVHSEEQPQSEVRFGAAVEVRNLAGATRRYRIVGVDEADAAHGALAFVAPLARALLGKSVGDVALVSTPAGEDELEVLAVSYD
jgi:transcription elongation factor GreB